MLSGYQTIFQFKIKISKILKILVCFGTRPEAIKMAPVIHELKKQKLDFLVCNTAQHKEMLDQVLEFFEIKTDYNLQVMQVNQGLNRLSAAILTEFDKVLVQEKPTMVLVHGDTTTSVMAAWAAFHREISVGHVEAGLRTYNPKSPFPEELNRQITAKLASIHFAPTAKAKQNLENEGISKESIHLTGNTIVDALNFGTKKLEDNEIGQISPKIDFKYNPSKKLIIVTGHRRESFGKGFENICKALLKIAERKDVEIVYPVHLNPNVQKPVYSALKNHDRIHLIKPVDYPGMLSLLKTCDFVISDSGGIQEEAPSFGKKVLVTREFSERMEGVNAGFSVLVGTDTSSIVTHAFQLLDNPENLQSKTNPYGDGKAAERIVEVLSESSLYHQLHKIT